jgi:sterol desaturase/sphingolipid hydroxylase (fatty acid hydroxylase superfamily)
MLEATIRLAVALAAFGTMAAWEYRSPRRDLVEPRRLRWPTNFGLAFLNAITVRLFAGGAALSAAVFAAEHRAGILHWIPMPVWAGWLVTILGLDFAVYLQHVTFHAVPALWRLHRVHHTDLGFDASTGIRFHPIEMLVSAGVKSALVVLLGASPVAVVTFEILLNASSLFNHGNVEISENLDRWLRRLIVTPDMHRIHHSSRILETNSNFGFSFSWWDRLCGTYRPEPALGQLRLQIGLSEYPEPLRLGRLLLLPFQGGAGRSAFAGTRPAEDRPERQQRRDRADAIAAEPRSRDTISPKELHERLSQADPPVVLDVRAAAELHGPLGHLEAVVNIPIDELADRLADLERWRTHLLVLT